MKPKTKTHHRVYKIADGIRNLNKREEHWAKSYMTCFVYAKKYEYQCLECGHVWPTKGNPLTVKRMYNGRQRVTKCPECKNLLVALPGKSRTWEEYGFLKFFHVYKGFQVVRVFYVNKTVRWDIRKPHYFIKETWQHWFDLKTGNKALRSISVNPMGGMFGPGFAWGSALSLRGEHERYYTEFDICPYKYISKIIKRNGYKGDFHGYKPEHFFAIILKYPIAETLLKSGKIGLFNAYGQYKKEINKYWSSFKIAFRHKFKFKKEIISDYIDHLQAVEALGLDLHSPKYVAPKNFKVEHQRLVVRHNRLKKKAKWEETLRTLGPKEEKYFKEKGRYFELNIQGKKVQIVAMTSLEQLMKEADMLHHCAFSTRYYENKDTLMMSAQVDGMPVETIEFNLKTMKVDQARGLQNKSSTYHKEIMELVKANTDIIRKLKESNRKPQKRIA